LLGTILAANMVLAALDAERSSVLERVSDKVVQLPMPAHLFEQLTLPGLWQVLGPMAFRRRDVITRLWRVVSHVLKTHAPGTPSHQAAFFSIQTCLLPATCLLPVQAFEWTLVWSAIADLRQVERFRLYYETSSIFCLEPRDRILGKGRKSDLASRLALEQGTHVAWEIGQLQKKAYLPKWASSDKLKVYPPPTRPLLVRTHPVLCARPSAFSPVVRFTGNLTRLMNSCKSHERTPGGPAPPVVPCLIFQVASNCSRKGAYPARAYTSHIVQEVQHTVRLMSKVVMSHPLAAAQRIVDLCRTFDNMGDIFVTFAAVLPLAVKEILLAECLRVCLLRGDKALRPEQEHAAAINHGNVCSFLGKLVAENEQLDLYAAFLYVAQGMRAQEQPSDVLIIESIFKHSMGARAPLHAGSPSTRTAGLREHDIGCAGDIHKANSA
jgi:hypothetical protein